MSKKTLERRTTNKIEKYRLYPLLKELGIPQRGLNGFTHTHASLLLSSGASPMTAQRQLRHSDPMTTLRSYAHVIGPDQREASEQVAVILRPDLISPICKREWTQ
jgi:integrase